MVCIKYAIRYGVFFIASDIVSYEIKTLREDATEAQMYYASIATFFQRVKSYFIQFITNQLPETGLIVPWHLLLTFTGKVVV